MVLKCKNCDLFFYFYWTIYSLKETHYENSNKIRKELVSAAFMMYDLYNKEKDLEKKKEIEKDINLILNIVYKYHGEM